MIVTFILSVVAMITAYFIIRKLENRYNKQDIHVIKHTTCEKTLDPADWWKNGSDPPY